MLEDSSIHCSADDSAMDAVYSAQRQLWNGLPGIPMCGLPGHSTVAWREEGQ